MALIIKTPKGIYDTPTDFEMEVEITSPIYTDKGSQTIAATLPGTKHNLSIVDHINRLDIANAPAKDVQVLYYWRSSPASVASNISAKTYCLEAAMKALRAHYDRMGVPAAL